MPLLLPEVPARGPREQGRSSGHGHANINQPTPSPAASAVCRANCSRRFQLPHWAVDGAVVTSRGSTGSSPGFRIPLNERGDAGSTGETCCVPTPAAAPPCSRPPLTAAFSYCSVEYLSATLIPGQSGDCSTPYCKGPAKRGSPAAHSNSNSPGEGQQTSLPPASPALPACWAGGLWAHRFLLTEQN